MDNDTLSKILLIIRPAAAWVARDGQIIQWLDAVQIQPTDAEIQNGLVQLQAKEAADAAAIQAAQEIIAGPSTVQNPDPRVLALITILQKKGII